MRIALAAQGSKAANLPMGFRPIYTLEATPSMYAHSADLFSQMRIAADRIEGYYILPVSQAKPLIDGEVETLNATLTNKSMLYYALNDFRDVLSNVNDGYVVI